MKKIRCTNEGLPLRMSKKKSKPKTPEHSAKEEQIIENIDHRVKPAEK